MEVEGGESRRKDGEEGKKANPYFTFHGTNKPSVSTRISNMTTTKTRVRRCDHSHFNDLLHRVVGINYMTDVLYNLIQREENGNHISCSLGLNGVKVQQLRYLASGVHGISLTGVALFPGFQFLRVEDWERG